MFASVELARELEGSGTDFLHASCASVRQRQPKAPVFTHRLAGGWACFTGPGSPLNKIAGIGFDGVPSAEEMEVVEQAYAAQKDSVQVELSTLANPEVGKMLTKRGYVLVGFENVLGKSLHATTPSMAAVDVRTSSLEQVALWLRTMAKGFSTPDLQGIPSHEEHDQTLIEGVFEAVAHVDGMHRYLAWRENEVLGAAGLYLRNRIAHFCGAATLPTHRRQGVQRAMFSTRLHDAQQAGCSLAVITTLPGSKSEQNAQNAGFSLLYARSILVRERS